MAKTLIYSNRKTAPMKWDVTSPENRARAFLDLFNTLKDDWKVYEGGELNPQDKVLYEKAVKGDAVAAEKLLKAHRHYEYEEWKIIDVPDAKQGSVAKAIKAR